MTALVAGGSNSSNSSTVYLAYIVASGTTYATAYQTATISLTPVAVSSTTGTVGTTKSAIVTTSSTATYAPDGIVSSDYLNGLVISSSSTAETYLFYNISNGTLGSSAIVSNPSGYTALTLGEGSQYGASGWTSGNGYGIAFIFQTDGSLSYVYQTSYQNGTINATTSLGTVGVPSSGFTSTYPAGFFVDPNGALWFGYTQFDKTSSSSTQGNAHPRISWQTCCPSLLTPGNSLISLFTLLCVVMGSLWVF